MTKLLTQTQKDVFEQLARQELEQKGDGKKGSIKGLRNSFIDATGIKISQVTVTAQLKELGLYIHFSKKFENKVREAALEMIKAKGVSLSNEQIATVLKKQFKQPISPYLVSEVRLAYKKGGKAIWSNSRKHRVDEGFLVVLKEIVDGLDKPTTVKEIRDLFKERTGVGFGEATISTALKKIGWKPYSLRGHRLAREHTQESLIGEIYGQWEIVGLAPLSKQGLVTTMGKIDCKCLGCGSIHKVMLNNLLRGLTSKGCRSCVAKRLHVQKKAKVDESK